MIYIQTEDVIGNAFISYLQETGKRELTMQKINDFATNVVRDLRSKGKKVSLELSRNKTAEFFYYNSDWFSYLEDYKIVVLKDGVTVKQLIEKFSGCLSVDAIVAFRNYDNIKTLFQNNIN